MFRIKVRDGWMIKKSNCVCFKIKTKSSCNRDIFIFISEMEEKRKEYTLGRQFVN
jgi:hypothetical protein